MKEIGGYIELDRYHLPMLHDQAIKLNCGRNALAYLIEAKRIRSIYFPRFMCDSCARILEKYNVEVHYYSIDSNLHPILPPSLNQNQWIYFVNYYGQFPNSYISDLYRKYCNIIVDNTQAYFQTPVNGIDTIYTCRKYFGVADGAILYTDRLINKQLIQDESFRYMNFLLGRYERTASEYYREYISNNNRFEQEPIKKMSKLTENLLHGIDYSYVCLTRTRNFKVLHSLLEKFNKLNLQVPEGAFMYPLYIENGAYLRERLLDFKIYVPTLWPSVLQVCHHDEIEYDLAKNILPLPVDQRYNEDDMNDMSLIIRKYII